MGWSRVQLGLVPIILSVIWSEYEATWGLGPPHPRLGVGVSFLEPSKDKLGTSQAT